MSFDLYAWKAPLVSEEDEAQKLLERFYEDDEVDVFERSEAVLRFHDELVTRYPDIETEPSDRVVDLSFSWSVPDDVLDDVVSLAQKLELVLYDPQGPCFHSPVELLVEPIRRDPAVLRQALVGTLIGVAVLGVGIVLPVPVVDWILIVVGGFIVVMGIYSVAVWLRE